MRIYFSFAIIFLLAFNTLLSQVSKQDSLALVDLYNNTDGAHWTDKSGWLKNGTPIKEWHGINVWGGRVRDLRLSNNNLSGQLPETIGNLDSLYNLELTYNELFGALPSSIGNWSTVFLLFLDNNNFSGPLPKEIGLLSHVERLHLDSNNFSGKIPKEIGNLSNLLTLDLDSNQFTGEIPPEIGNLSKLEQFRGNNNLISGTVPKDINQLTNLQYLWLNDNKIENLPNLVGLDSLKELKIERNKLTFEDIENIPNLNSEWVTYSPQDSVGETKDTVVFVGSTLVLSSNVGGNYNTYKWKHNGSILSQETNNTLKIENIIKDHEGYYSYEVKNTIATELTLYSRRIFVSVITERENDSLALVDLYDSLSTINSDSMTNWLSGPINTWHGVTVVDNRVTELNLRESKLTGKIPYSIGNLTALNKLWLFSNEIYSRIPNSIGNLTKLVLLNLSHNKLVGNIPNSIGNLTKLKSLALNDNSIVGPIPEDIKNLTNLESLEIYNCPIGGEIPEFIGNLTNLKTLRLNYCQFTSKVPKSFVNLTKLERLVLNTNNIIDTIPSFLGNLDSLIEIGLSSNKLYGEIPQSFQNLKKLNTLNLENTNSLTGLIPSFLGNLEQLRALYLSGNNFYGEIPGTFKNLINLEYLRLANNNLSGEIPQDIQKLTKLKSIWLNNNQFTGSFLSEFDKLDSLKDILISHNNFTRLPKLILTNQLKKFEVQNNKLTFQDIIKNLNKTKEDVNFIYSPQDSIGNKIDTLVLEGTYLELKIPTYYEGNKYKWLRIVGTDTTFLGQYPDSIYKIDSVTKNHEGMYLCQITNDLAPNLTLYSKPIIIHTHNIGYEFTINNSLNKIQLACNFAKEIDSVVITFSIGNKSNFHSLDTWTNVKAIQTEINNVKENSQYFFEIKIVKDNEKINFYDSIRSNIQNWVTAFPPTSQYNNVSVDPKYSLVSIPYIPTKEKFIKEIFKQTESYDSTKLRIFSINSNGDNYKELDKDWNKVEMLPGYSFLASSREQLKLHSSYGISVYDSSKITVISNGEWALLSNPFADSVNVTDIFEGKQMNNNNFFSLNSSGRDWVSFFYLHKNKIAPYEPFLVRINKKGKFFINNSKFVHSSPTTIIGEYKILGKIIFKYDQSNNKEILYFGTHENSIDGLDEQDILVPPSFLKESSYAFNIPNKSQSLLGDFRSIGKTLYEFKISKKFSRKQKTSLSVSKIKIHENFKTIFIDKKNNTSFESAEFFNISGSLELSLIVGQTDKVNDLIKDFNVVPSNFHVYNNYPNPFNNSTIIKYDLPNYSNVSVELFNTLGQRVKQLVKNEIHIGSQKIVWHGDDDLQESVSSGCYILHIKTDFGSVSKKIMYVK